MIEAELLTLAGAYFLGLEEFLIGDLLTYCFLSGALDWDFLAGVDDF